MSIHDFWNNKIKVRSGAEALAAASFTVVICALYIWFAYAFFYNGLPDYSDFIAGGTVYSAYFKQGDLWLFYGLFLLVPISTILFLTILHKICDLKTEDVKTAQIVRVKGIVDYCTECLVVVIAGSFGLIALCAAAEGRLIRYREMLAMGRNVCIGLWSVLVVGYFVYTFKNKINPEDFCEKLMGFIQLLFPFCLLGYFGFYYQYEAEAGYIELFHSAKWKWFCVLLFVVLFAVQIVRIWLKKYELSLSSLALIGSMSVASTPEGILSVDFFHNGEMALPMQQLVSFHKMPYFDFDPIHGFCDYVFSAFNYLFFDGTYFSQSPSIMVASLFMAAALAITVGVCLGNQKRALLCIWLFMPFLVEKAGVRYFIFFIAFLILLSERVQKDSARFIWWWVMLCIVGIAYNVSIGSSMAVAFLPEVLCRVKKDFMSTIRDFSKREKKERIGLLVAYLIMLIVGICYIPLFLQIVRFLRENAGTTLWVNGTAIFGTEFHLVETFAFLIPYACILLVACIGKRKGISAFTAVLVCLFVICNYACIRYDEGLRLAVLGVFFGFVCISYFSKEIRSGKCGYILFAALLVTELVLIRNYLPVRVGALMATESVPAEAKVEIKKTKVTDPIVFVSGDSVDMPHLGTGFIQGLTLNSLKNVQTVLQNEQAENSYLDLTNKISHYVILDCEASISYSSAYNISNHQMQQSAIAQIKEKEPRLILLSPYIRFDEAPVSLRSYELYTAIMDMGYKPYAYEDVVYLLKGDSLFADAKDGTRALGLLNHRTDLAMLPYLWGTAIKERQDELIELTKEQMADSTKMVRFVDFEVERGAIQGDSFSVSFKSDVDGEKYEFLISTGVERLRDGDYKVHYLIPVASSAFYHESQKVELQVTGLKDGSYIMTMY